MPQAESIANWCTDASACRWGDRVREQNLRASDSVFTVRDPTWLAVREGVRDPTWLAVREGVRETAL